MRFPVKPSLPHRLKTPRGFQVEVGKWPSKTVFIEDPELLYNRTRFFAAALRPEWEQSNPVPFRLPEATPAAWKVYSHALARSPRAVLRPSAIEHPFYLPYCKGHLSAAQMTAYEKVSRRSNEDAFNDIEALTEAWILGDFLHDYSFCNAINAKIWEEYKIRRFIPAGSTIKRCWHRLPEWSSLRRLLLDIAADATKNREALRRTIAHTYPGEFLADLFQKLHLLKDLERLQPRDRTARETRELGAFFQQPHDYWNEPPYRYGDPGPARSVADVTAAGRPASRIPRLAVLNRR